MPYAVLAVLLLQSAVGLAMLLGLRRQRRINATALVHAVLADAALALWIAFVVVEDAWIAWASFAVVLLGNVFGDLLLIAHWRGRTGQKTSFGKDYNASISSVLRGQHPKVPTAHAAGAGIVTVLMLIAAILA